VNGEPRTVSETPSDAEKNRRVASDRRPIKMRSAYLVHWWITPFTPWQAMIMSLIIALMGFCGGLVMSAIKRDRGVKDYGTIIPGHGGIMDRIDSLCFAAPIFFHLTRYYFT
jgi:predicted CDP-diglyceride synthetase/phosphatidate cytidylyltransferase